MSQIILGCSRGYNYSNYFTAGKWPENNNTPNFVMDHGADVYAVAVDSAGNIITGGVRTGSVTTRKYDSSGNLLWSIDHGQNVLAVAVDSSDNIYTGSSASAGGYYLKKYDSAGVLQWQHNAFPVYGLFVDDSDNIWAVGTRIQKLSAARYSLYYNTNPHGGNILYAIAVDASGNFFVAGAEYSGVTTKSYNSAGTLQWSAGHGAVVRAITLDSSGNVYTAGIQSYGVTARKYDSAGSLQLSISSGSNAYSLKRDVAGGIYIGGDGVSKYSSGGTAVYSITPYGFVSVTAYGLVILESPAGFADAPGIPLGLALGVPTTEKSHDAPGIPLGLALGVPTVPAIPQPPVGDGQAIYRCYLTGMPSLIELPIESIQCRKRKNSSTWLAAKALGTSSLESMLLDAVDRGGEIVIYAGIRDSAGTETLGELLRAILTEFSMERTIGAIIYSITARVDVVLEPLQTRSLYGVSQRSDDNGRESVTCAVNPRVRPGDTVDDGERTFEAHSILYLIEPVHAQMTIEAAPNG